MPKEIPITKNGHEPLQAFRLNSAGRVYPVTPDGSQWEVRIHMMADFSKLVAGAPPGGEEIIGEVIVRTFNGGLAPLIAMGKDTAVTTEKLVKKIMHELEKAQRGGVEVVSELPEHLKGN
jgi:hypothetical protein